MTLAARLTAGTVAIVLLMATAIGLMTYRSVETAILPGEFERVQTHVNLLAAELETDVP